MVRFFARPLAAVIVCAAAAAGAMIYVNNSPALAQEYSPSLYQAMQWRNIGPFRGGRVTAVEGVPSAPRTFYMGATGGGVWKTTDAGVTWNNISDGYFKTGSVGDIAVSPSDPNVVYVGMGESPVRGVTTSHGDGVYKSTDGGRSWTHLGLEKTRHISRVVVHPTNPDIVYAAAQGSPWRPNPERGVYRSADGGKTWSLVLHTNNDSGASELQMDPHNPRILYAGMWQHRRKAWHGYQLHSGGPGSGLYKSVDGGETWTRLKKGLPEPAGKFGVAISGADSDRLYVLVEAKQGESGLYRSDDQGETFEQINDAHVLSMRSAYYLRVIADPLDRDTLYVLNAPFLKSIDGGKTFERRPVPHGDNHDLWIHPQHSGWMIEANDGGVNVSYNGGDSWSTQGNQPTAQFYRVNADNLFPYNVYGAQQDNTTVKTKSRTFGPGIGWKDWYPVGGGESGYLVFDPDNPVLIYSGNYQGQISEYDDRTGVTRDVRHYPLGTAYRPGDQYPFRFNWNAPIVVSQYDSSVIYHGAQMVLKSTDRGHSWTEISPDLTRNDPSKQGIVEGDFSVENTAGEMYNTIFYIAESPHRQGELWVGTDDGLVYLTRDDGAHWENITPKGLGETQINMIEVSPHHPGKAYAVVAGYKFNDFQPHIYVTTDYGKSWKNMTNGIVDGDFVRVVREDPERDGLLYAGAETAAYVSFDGGARWQSLQLNLPHVPVTDLKVHGHDLLASTQGRAFWILDDVDPLRQISREVADADVYLFKPAPEKRVQVSRRSLTPGAGENPPTGTVIYYTLKTAQKGQSAPVKLEILDASGAVINSYGGGEGQPLPAKAGMNRFVWNWSRAPLPAYDNLRPAYGVHAYRAAPGTYTARLTAAGKTVSQTFEVEQDPRVETTPAEEQEKQAILADIFADADAASAAVQALILVRKRVGNITELLDGADAKPIRDAGAAVTEAIGDWLNDVIEEDNAHFIDAQHSATRLDFSLLEILRMTDGMDAPITEGMKDRIGDVRKRWADRKADYDAILSGPLAAFNELTAARSIPPVRAQAPEPPAAGEKASGDDDDWLEEEQGKTEMD